MGREKEKHSSWGTNQSSEVGNEHYLLIDRRGDLCYENLLCMLGVNGVRGSIVM